jgi:hypothetical protein
VHVGRHDTVKACEGEECICPTSAIGKIEYAINIAFSLNGRLASSLAHWNSNGTATMHVFASPYQHGGFVAQAT